MNFFLTILFKICLFLLSLSFYFGTALSFFERDNAHKGTNALEGQELALGDQPFNNEFKRKLEEIMTPFSPPGPEQIHISYGDSPSEMVILWSTASNGSSLVLYGTAPNNYTLTGQGVCVEFNADDGNPDGLHFIHRVQLKGLKPNTNYSYKVRTENETSQGFTLTTMMEGQDWSPVFLVYGDMGKYGGSPSLKMLTKEALSGSITAVLHVGDFAYDLQDQGGKVGDDFMNRIQTLATRVPYMTAVGNHEIPFNFSHYRHRFSMPRTNWPIPVDKMWYSFNIARAHFISYSTEVFFTNEGLTISEQYQWLLKDLQTANLPENRAKQPWIIAYGHRPMYCSNIDGDDCTKTNSEVRAGLEELFYSQGVDIIIEAHEHSYERLWPVYNYTTHKSYKDYAAPVHLISGSAGCNEFDGICVDPIPGPRGEWSAFRAWMPGLYGFGRLHVLNDSHIFWEQVVAFNDDVMDSIWIVRNNHGPYP